MIRKLFVFVFVIFILTSNSTAADDFKVAVIDFKAFMDLSTIGKAIQKEIQDKGEKLKSELDKIQAELKVLQERYQREAFSWTQEKKQEEEKSFKIKINDFNKLRIEKEKEFSEFRVKKLGEANLNVIEYATKRAKEEGYYLIFEKQTGSILYADGSINITDELIRDMDKSTKKQ